MTEPLSFEKSVPGRIGCSLPAVPEGIDIQNLIGPQFLRRSPAELPELGEVEVVRHFTRLSRLNYAVDLGLYPLGSCTMKYNPKINEELAALPGFGNLHPLAEEQDSQGLLRTLWELEEYLCELTGMDAFTLAPLAGAQGELTGLLLIRAFHEHQGHARSKVLVPDSAHGTNPASATLAGYQSVSIPSTPDGLVDMDQLDASLGPEVAALMLTNPNTVGLWENHIEEIARRVHQHGALLYYDGANLNAVVGRCRPGDMGFDVVHLNLHKTFSTPHGGGGPGSGPVGVKQRLEPFLPLPRLCESKPDSAAENAEERRGVGWCYDRPLSIGQLGAFYGNVGILLRAYVYIRMLGAAGLRKVSDCAVLNANYLLNKLSSLYPAPYGNRCMHEFVLSVKGGPFAHTSAAQVGKRILDYGYHAPTVYFPLIVPECLMVEPTETETQSVLDEFAAAMAAIAQEAQDNPDLLANAPLSTPVRKLDEVQAARQPQLVWPLG